MKKSIAALLLCALILLSLSSCSDEVIDISTDDGAVLAENSLLNFYFYYPSDWEIDKNEAMISIYKNDAETFQTDLEVNGEPYTIIEKTNISAIAFGVISSVASVEDYWENFCVSQMENLGNFTLTSSAESALGELDAKRYDFTVEIGGVLFQYAQIFALDRGVIYTVTYTASPEKFPEHEETLSKVVETFTLK